MNSFLNVRHPWFRPLWARLVVAGLVLGWTAFEFLRGAPFWGLLFGAAGAWLVHQWFIVFDPRDYEPKDKSDV
jgi:hypothetical protein